MLALILPKGSSPDSPVLNAASRLYGRELSSQWLKVPERASDCLIFPDILPQKRGSDDSFVGTGRLSGKVHFGEAHLKKSSTWRQRVAKGCRPTHNRFGLVPFERHDKM